MSKFIGLIVMTALASTALTVLAASTEEKNRFKG